jgi:hypothetical protein
LCPPAFFSDVLFDLLQQVSNFASLVYVDVIRFAGELVMLRVDYLDMKDFWVAGLSGGHPGSLL